MAGARPICRAGSTHGRTQQVLPNVVEFALFDMSGLGQHGAVPEMGGPILELTEVASVVRRPPDAVQSFTVPGGARVVVTDDAKVVGGERFGGLCHDVLVNFVYEAEGGASGGCRDSAGADSDGIQQRHNVLLWRVGEGERDFAKRVNVEVFIEGGGAAMARVQKEANRSARLKVGFHSVLNGVSGGGAGQRCSSMLSSV